MMLTNTKTSDIDTEVENDLFEVELNIYTNKTTAQVRHWKESAQRIGSFLSLVCTLLWCWCTDGFLLCRGLEDEI